MLTGPNGNETLCVGDLGLYRSLEQNSRLSCPKPAGPEYHLTELRTLEPARTCREILISGPYGAVRGRVDHQHSGSWEPAAEWRRQTAAGLQAERSGRPRRPSPPGGAVALPGEGAPPGRSLVPARPGTLAAAAGWPPHACSRHGAAGGAGQRARSRARGSRFRSPSKPNPRATGAPRNENTPRGSDSLPFHGPVSLEVGLTFWGAQGKPL